MNFPGLVWARVIAFVAVIGLVWALVIAFVAVIVYVVLFQ